MGQTSSEKIVGLRSLMTEPGRINNIRQLYTEFVYTE